MFDEIAGEMKVCIKRKIQNSHESFLRTLNILERNVIDEHFCYGNTLPLLTKLEKTIQISVWVSPAQKLRLSG